MIAISPSQTRTKKQFAKTKACAELHAARFAKSHVAKTHMNLLTDFFRFIFNDDSFRKYTTVFENHRKKYHSSLRAKRATFTF